VLRKQIGENLGQKDSWLQSFVGNVVEWELKRYGVSPASYPAIGLADNVKSLTGEEVIAGFTLQNGKPVMALSLNHPTVRTDPAQLLMSIFHETHHLVDWTKDPFSYKREKNLPGDDPIEQLHESEALEDLHAFLKYFVQWMMSKQPKS